MKRKKRERGGMGMRRREGRKEGMTGGKKGKREEGRGRGGGVSSKLGVLERVKKRGIYIVESAFWVHTRLGFVQVIYTPKEVNSVSISDKVRVRVKEKIWC